MFEVKFAGYSILTYVLHKIHTYIKLLTYHNGWFPRFECKKYLAIEVNQIFSLYHLDTPSNQIYLVTFICLTSFIFTKKANIAKCFLISVKLRWHSDFKNHEIWTFSQFSMSKNVRIFLNIFSLKNMTVGAHFFIIDIF